MNKQELEKEGYFFRKIGRVEYLDLSPPKQKIARYPILEAEQQIRNHFIKKSKQKGKALSIILPLVSQGQMTNLLSELYDLREESEKRKFMDQMQEKQIEEDFKVINHVLGDVLTEIKKEKCRPTKKQPKRKPQKKRVAKKK